MTDRHGMPRPRLRGTRHHPVYAFLTEAAFETIAEEAQRRGLLPDVVVAQLLENVAREDLVPQLLDI